MTNCQQAQVCLNIYMALRLEFCSVAPPHGGIAWGFDRLMMILQNEENIREVIAFPKTGEGKELMLDSPSEVSEKQLQELELKLDRKN
jgi:aspartyl-tRNA synthetase